MQEAAGPIAPEALARHAAVQAALAASEDAGLRLDGDDILIYKRRLLDLLLPGETPLGALRRLGAFMIASADCMAPCAGIC